MLLAIDIGNSQTKIGAFAGDNKLVHSFCVETERGLVSFQENLKGLSLESIEKVVLASVVPKQSFVWEQWFQEKKISLLRADQKAPWSFRVSLPHPELLGSDRMASAEGVLGLGKSTIIVDSGTATSFGVLSKEEGGFVYVGGAICPGVGISMEALVSKAALLHPVDLSRASCPSSVVGYDTETGMRSGVVWGFVSMVDGMVAAIRRERGFSDCAVVATGGFSYLLKNLSKEVTHFKPHLTLEGLHAVAQH